MSAENFYNNLFRNNETVFGIKPLKVVEDILQFKQKGTVIDLGAGEGRNALFLAQQGFDVIAIDNSLVGIDKIKHQAEIEGINIDVQTNDITQYEFSENPDLFLAILILHLLSRTDAERIISSMQEHTNIGGLNIIKAFTQNGDFYKDDNQKERFYLYEGELEERYKDWEILKSVKTTGKSVVKDENGNPYINQSVEFIARKIK